MDGSREETKRLLSLYRRGLITDDDLVEQLEEVRAERVVASDGKANAKRGDERSLVSVLDGYRAAEESGAATLRRWAETSRDAALAGGLRTLAAREAVHAELLAQRVRELGAEPSAEVPHWLADYNTALLDPEASDSDRLEAVVSQFPDIEAALAPLEQTIARLEQDPLTREMLRTIGQDERSSLEWLHAAHQTRSAARS